MQLIIIFIAWLLFGRWMFLCLGLPPKQCFQCVIGRYLGLMIVIALSYMFFDN